MNGYERSQIMVAISMVAIAVLAILLFDSPVPFFIVCLIAVLIVAIYVTIPILLPEKKHLKKPIIYNQGDQDENVVHIVVSRFSTDNNNLIVLIDGTIKAKLFRGSSIDLKVSNGIHEFTIDSIYGKKTIAVDDQSHEMIYMWFDKDLTYHVESVTQDRLFEYESMNQKTYREYCNKLKKKLPFVIGGQIAVVLLICLYIIKYV